MTCQGSALRAESVGCVFSEARLGLRTPWRPQSHGWTSAVAASWAETLERDRADSPAGRARGRPSLGFWVVRVLPLIILFNENSKQGLKYVELKTPFKHTLQIEWSKKDAIWNHLNLLRTLYVYLQRQKELQQHHGTTALSAADLIDAWDDSRLWPKLAKGSQQLLP